MGALPLTIVPLVLYVLAGLVIAGRQPVAEAAGVGAHPFWDTPLTVVTLVSGETVALTWGVAMIVVALGALLVSLMLTTAAGRARVGGNLLKVVVLGAHVVMFLALPFCGTGVFLILTVVALVDTVAAVTLPMLVAQDRSTDAAG